MTQFKFCFCLLVCLTFPLPLMAHGYSFALHQEEMRDNIRIDLHGEYITIMYESVYMGQIAPHTRLMIDTNSDSVLSRTEIDHFFEDYGQSLNAVLQYMPIQIGDSSRTMKLLEVFAPSLPSDSLLAPLHLTMLFSLGDISLTSGEKELVIDPKLFFENGNHLIRMAQNRVTFTDHQKEDIGRYLQIMVFASEGIEFISTHPGRLKQGNKMVYIYGVFFEKDLLNLQNPQAPQFRIKFRIQ